MISREGFVNLTSDIGRLQDYSNRVSEVIGVDGTISLLDEYIDQLLNDIIVEFQNNFDSHFHNSHVDIGEIFWNWWNKNTKFNTLVIDNQEYNPTTAEEWYDTYLLLVEKFVEAYQIEYATPKGA